MSSNTSTVTESARRPHNTTAVDKTTTAAARGLIASGDVDGGSGDGGGDLTNLDSSAALEATKTLLLLLGRLASAKAR